MHRESSLGRELTEWEAGSRETFAIRFKDLHANPRRNFVLASATCTLASYLGRQKKEGVGLVGQSNNKNQSHLFFGYLVVGSTAIAWKIFFFQVAVEGGLRPPLFGNATGFTSLLFSSASQGRKTSFSRVV